MQVNMPSFDSSKTNKQKTVIEHMLREHMLTDSTICYLSLKQWAHVAQLYYSNRSFQTPPNSVFFFEKWVLKQT